jgi:hypothetical protein
MYCKKKQNTRSYNSKIITIKIDKYVKITFRNIFLVLFILLMRSRLHK